MNTSTLKTEESPVSESLDKLILQSKALMAVDSGIMITDRQARILWVNPAFSKSTGYPAAEVVGRTPRVLKSGSHDPSFYREFWDTVLRGETWRGQFVNQRRDGGLCIHEQTTTPVRWQSSGPITHFISVSQDVTDGRKCKVDSREIRNMEVAGQLAAGITHHFNNLLTTIHANSELLLEINGNSHPESSSLVEGTLAASRNAAHLIRQLVGFSQNQVCQFQALDLNRVVECSLHLLYPAPKNNVQCERHYHTNLPCILADSGMLGQVIRHLLVNALDAMPQGGRLTLTTERLITAPTQARNHQAARPGEFVCLTIGDTGCGIPPTNLPRIFEPFFTTKNAGDRSGLGLALVYGIVKQHHGWTEVSSQVGRGTTFKVFLPVATKSSAFATKAPVKHQPPGLTVRSTHFLPGLEPEAGETSGKEPFPGRAVVPVNGMPGESPYFWGIND